MELIGFLARLYFALANVTIYFSFVSFKPYGVSGGWFKVFSLFFFQPFLFRDLELDLASSAIGDGFRLESLALSAMMKEKLVLLCFYFNFSFKILLINLNTH